MGCGWKRQASRSRASTRASSGDITRDVWQCMQRQAVQATSSVGTLVPAIASVRERGAGRGNSLVIDMHDARDHMCVNLVDVHQQRGHVLVDAHAVSVSMRMRTRAYLISSEPVIEEGRSTSP